MMEGTSDMNSETRWFLSRVPLVQEYLRMQGNVCGVRESSEGRSRWTKGECIDGVLGEVVIGRNEGDRQDRREVIL